jgi:hypothetical protein
MKSRQRYRNHHQAVCEETSLLLNFWIIDISTDLQNTSSDKMKLFDTTMIISIQYYNLSSSKIQRHLKFDVEVEQNFAVNVCM